MDVTNGVPGVNAADPTTFEEFWPYYVSQHLHPATRAIHVGATTAALACGAAGVAFFNPVLVAASPVIGYGPAWASHCSARARRLVPVRRRPGPTPIPRQRNTTAV